MKPEPLFRLPSLPHSSCCFKCQIWSGACLVADLCSLEMAFQKGGCKPWLGCSVNSDWRLGILSSALPPRANPGTSAGTATHSCQLQSGRSPCLRPQSLLFLNRPTSPTGSFLHLPLHLSPPSLWPLPCFALSVSYPLLAAPSLARYHSSSASSLCGPICPHLSSSSILSVSPSVPASEPRGFLPFLIL